MGPVGIERKPEGEKENEYTWMKYIIQKVDKDIHYFLQEIYDKN